MVLVVICSSSTVVGCNVVWIRVGSVVAVAVAVVVRLGASDVVAGTREAESFRLISRVNNFEGLVVVLQFMLVALSICSEMATLIVRISENWTISVHRSIITENVS